MEKLKPCPFCGSDKSIQEIQVDDMCDAHWIECSECFCRTGIEKTLLHARARWNKRTPVTPMSLRYKKHV